MLPRLLSARETMGEQRHRSSAVIAAASAMICATLLAGALDGALAAASRFAAPLPASGRALLALFGAGLYAVPALVLGAAAAAFALLGRRSPGPSLGPQALLGVGAVAVFARLAERALSAEVENAHLGGLLVALAAVAVSSLLLLTPAVGTVDDRLRARWPWTRLPRLPAPSWIAAAAAVLALAAHYEEDLSLLDRAPLLGLLLVAGLRAALLLPRLRARVPARPAWLALLVAACLGAGALAAVALTPAHVAALRSGGLLSGPLARAARAATDRDGDGSSALYGGRDCNDRDPAIGPDSEDTPGDGIDQDCDGRDAAERAAGALLPKQGPSKLPVAVPRGGFDLVVVVIDTVRADHVSAYGYERRTTPRLDALAEESVLFERAAAPSTATRFSLLGYHYGSSPSALSFETTGKGKKKRWFVAAKERPVAGVLKRVGLSTHAVVSCFRTFKRYFGIARGFDRYDDETVCQPGYRLEEKKADVTTDAAVAAHKKLAKRNKPLYLYVHYLDVHEPYTPPAGYDRFGSEPMDRYDGMIAWVDHQVGRLVDALRASGRWDRTVLIVTSDHGEEFGEHGGRFHGHKLYEELTHVPLIVRVPGVAPRRTATPVSGLDIAPTLLDLARTPAKWWPHLPGRSLVPALTEDDLDRPIYVENGKYGQNERMDHAVMRGPWKLISMRADDTLELYDLEADPEESRNLAGAGHPQEQPMRELLEQVRAELRAIRRSGEAPATDPRADAGPAPTSPSR